MYPTASGGSSTEFYIDPAKARDAFAGDLSDQQAALIAATQRPVAETAFSEPNGPPAWKHLPSWAVVATANRAAGSDVTRSNGGTCRRQDHGARRVARDHGLATGGRDERDPRRGGRGHGVARRRREMPITTDPETGLGAVSQIDAGPLNVGYLDRGPTDGPAVVLLHGWPYDIHSFAEVVPLLTAAGHRVIVPYLRGFGTRRLLSDKTVRNGEQAALALDAIAVMDALGIETAVVAGFDWGSAKRATSSPRSGPTAAAGLVSVSGYLIGAQKSGQVPLPPEAEFQWWYQYYFATERGARLRQIPA